MSLINDALKRATETSPTASPTAPGAEPQSPMQPVDYQQGRGGLPWYFFPALLLVLAGACWFIVQGINASRQGAIVAHAREPQPAPAPAAPPASAAEELSAEAQAFAASLPPLPTTQPEPAAIPNRSFSLEDVPAATIAPTPLPVVPAPAPAKPAFKLQGIFYRPASPSAMVNGKQVNVGGRVGAATVMAITRDSVTLEAGGQTTVLTLE